MLFNSKKEREQFEKALEEAAIQIAEEKMQRAYRDRLENMVAQRLRDYDHMTVLQRRELIIDSMDTLDAIDEEMERRFCKDEKEG